LLYERGGKKRRTQNLSYILDWLLYVPESLSERLQHETNVWEEEDFKVRYISSIERLALVKGQAIGELAAIGDVAAFMA